jgi:S1-C subfamily serine protease
MRSISPLIAALGGGLVSGVLVAALFLGTGAGGDGENDDGPVAPRSAEARTAAPRAPTVSDVYRRVRPGVLVVESRPDGVPWPEGEPTDDDGVATGSGFAIADGRRVVTNHHVVADADDIVVHLGGKRVPARLLGSDATTDLAVLRLPRNASPLPEPLALGDSDALRPGDTALAIGNPYGLRRSVTIGVVSGLNRRMEAPDGSSIRNAIQTDAAINPGNSGGPLLDASGRVVGVIAQGRGDGIAFAVPATTLERFESRLARGPARGP